MQNEPTFITLSEALSWLAFGKQYKKEALITHLAETNYSEDTKEKLDIALVALLAKARGALIDLEGKKTASESTAANNVLTIKIVSTEFANFAAFDITTGGLRHGKGLLWLPEPLTDNELSYQVPQIKRTRHYVDVDVNFSQLKKELQPGRQSLPALSDGELKKWWGSLTKEQAQLGEKAHKQMLTERFPNNHVARSRLREVRNTKPQLRGRPKVAKK
jgi:hypothetical protein